MKCLKTNKVCSKYNRKCKVCTLDDPRKAYSMTDYEEYMKEKQEMEVFENSIPNECKRCTLLDKDYLHNTVKCLYRSNDKCMLN